MLCLHAHAAPEPPAPSRRAASPRSHAPSPRPHAPPARPHAATRWRGPQGRAAAPAPRQAADGQAGRAQAAGLARPRTAPAAAADAGVGNDRRRVRERRPDLSALPRPHGGHRPHSRNHRGDRVRRAWQPRSEEHTSELQSPCNLVCRLLLEKKKKKQKTSKYDKKKKNQKKNN